MGFFKDAKNILLGVDGSEQEEDFKSAIEEAVKSGKIDKARAAELIQTRNKVKKEAIELDKKQQSSISLEDGTRVSAKDAKRKKQELELKKANKEKQKRISNEINNKNLKINREKLQRLAENDEMDLNQNLNIKERDENN